MTKTNQRIAVSPLLQAKEDLVRAVAQAKKNNSIKDLTDLFAHTYHLAINTLQEILQAAGFENLDTHHKIITQAQKNKLIKNAAVWHKFKIQKDLSSHAQDVDDSFNIFDAVELFTDSLDELLEVLT